MKLSPTQFKTLKAMAEEGNLAHFIHGIDAHWFLSSTMRTIRMATIDRLANAKLIEVKQDRLGWYPDTAVISQAGREYLAKLEATP